MKTRDVEASAPLPWSPDGEQSVLGGLLIDPDAMLRLADSNLSAGSFYDHRHRVIWSAITTLIASRQPVDIVTVHAHLQDAGQAEECGGLAYLNALAQSVPSAANIAGYAELVTDKALRRGIAKAAVDAHAAAFAPGDANAALDAVQALFSSLQRMNGVSAPQKLSELIAKRLDHWTDVASGAVSPGLPTGIDKLDSALGGGLRPGRVVVVAARPSVGKTSVAQQIGLTVAKHGHPVLMLSQEMPAGDLVDRAVAHLGSISLERIAAGRLRDDDWSRITGVADDASALPFFVDDQPALTLLHIRAKARQVQQQHGLSLLIVDYLQLCASTSTFDKRHHQIEQISRGLKTLAKEFNVCVLLLSQLNRESERDEPELVHLKESGAIEEDADVVILLHPLGKDVGGALLTVAKVVKNRQGRRGRLGLAFHGDTQRWTESDSDVSRRKGGQQ